jgi:methionyl aminopeptidase
MNHPGDFNTKRTTDAEFRDKDKLHTSKVNDLRKAAECHRQVRKYAQTFIRPGMKLIDICERIEETNKRLVEANGLAQGIAFPTGCSINHCAAHYTPNPGDETVLGKDDVMKIDFGT